MRSFLWLSMFVLSIIMGAAMAGSAELLPLPPPQTEGGMPLKLSAHQQIILAQTVGYPK